MKFTDEIAILTAAAVADTEGNYQDVSDYDYGVISFNTASSANCTVKFAGSIMDTCPDMSATQSTTVRYDYLDITDLQSGASIDGDTGIAPAGTDDHRLFRVDLRGLKWFGAIMTARSAGSATVKAKFFTEN